MLVTGHRALLKQSVMRSIHAALGVVCGMQEGKTRQLKPGARLATALIALKL